MLHFQILSIVSIDFLPFISFCRNVKKYGPLHRYYFMFGRERLAIADPQIIKYITTTNAKNFIKPPSRMRWADPWNGHSSRGGERLNMPPQSGLHLIVRGIWENAGNENIAVDDVWCVFNNTNSHLLRNIFTLYARCDICRAMAHGILPLVLHVSCISHQDAEVGAWQWTGAFRRGNTCKPEESHESCLQPFVNYSYVTWKYVVCHLTLHALLNSSFFAS